MKRPCCPTCKRKLPAPRKAKVGEVDFGRFFREARTALAFTGEWGTPFARDVTPEWTIAKLRIYVGAGCETAALSEAA